jgi:plastocyanin
MSRRRNLLWFAMLWAGAAGLHAQAAPAPSMSAAPTTAAMTTAVRGRVEVIGGGGAGAAKTRHATIPETVVWLTPLTAAGSETTAAMPDSPSVVSGSPTASSAPTLQLVQKNKSFEPHILVVPAGSMVEFPNHDPFFHNVFSLFEGKRFDLGLYEAGTSRMVRFDRPGVSYIFCNIHPEMSAVVITIATPLYAVSNAEGQLNLAGVPYGRYLLHVWSEGMGPENAQPRTRAITIAENASSLGVIRVPEANGQPIAHKNKYGRDYDAPTPDNSVYNQQR